MRNTKLSYRIIVLLVILSLISGLMPGSRVSAQSLDQVLAKQRFQTASGVESASALLNTAGSAAISVSRVQSGYLASPLDGTLTITYTVSNNRPPTLFPIVPPGATITETLNLTSGFDSSRDPNTIRDVLLATELTSAATYHSAAPFPDQDGSRLAWNLGDIPPMTSKSAVLTIDVPSSVTDFTDLDTGAAAWGVQYGRSVSNSARPAVLIPANFSQWLIWTVDADRFDESMLEKSAELGQDPTALFDFVRGLGYESYPGSLRGTPGTLWSGAGNSIDQSSLLIAMLRAAGIPARYRHGSLSSADVQVLIGSMFPTPTQYSGYIPSGTSTADPLNDADLLAETSDHWWVEAYLPGQGWVDMDPSFASAAIGQSFATPSAGGNDSIAELPDSLRHKIRLRLKIEDYYPLNTGQGNLSYSYPLDFTFNSVEIATQPVSFANLVDTEGQPGLVFTAVTHTYTPYLLIGEEAFLGQSYQDVFTNFALGTIFHTGLWLSVELIHPDGSSETHERELADRIGVAARQAGGSLSINLAVSSSTPPLVTPFDIYTTGFWPNLVPEGTLERSRASALLTLDEINADAQRLMELDAASSLSPVDEEDLRRIRYNFQVNMARYLWDVGLTFAEAADRLLVDTQAGVFVRAYYDSPRLVTVGVQPGDGSDPTFTLDLRNTSVRTIPFPGQAETAAIGFNMVKGIVESGLEGAALSSALGQTALTTARLFEAATAQGIGSTIITDNNLSWLESLPISEEAKARITTSALEGKILIVPQTPVLVDGDTYMGWWEVDSVSGETIGVMENGLHVALLEYLAGLGAGAVIAGPITDLILGYTSYVLGFVSDRIDKAIGDNTFDLQSYLYEVATIATATTCLTGLASIIFDPDVLAFGNCFAGLVGVGMGQGAPPTDFFGLGQQTAQQYLDSVVDYDPPVPQNWQAVAPPDTSQAITNTVISVPASTSAKNLSATLDAGDLTLSGTVDGGWNVISQHSFMVGSMTTNGTLRDSNGLSLGSGTVSAVPASGSAFSLLASPSSLALDGSGRFSYFAPALSGLGGSASWEGFTAQLNPGGTDTLVLQDASVTLNGVTHTGSFTLDTSSTINVSGLGLGPSANFASSASWQSTAARVRVGPASGTATLDGSTLDVSNGLAVARYDGVLPVSENSPTTDQVTLNDSVDLFTLGLTPPSSSTDPGAAVSFQADIFANVTDYYTLTVKALAGWDVQLAGDGSMSVLPPDGAAPGDYDIRVTAQSGKYPDLSLSAIHTVSVDSYDDFSLAVVPDDDFTVPMGPVLDSYAVTGSTNTGQAQIPGAAYTIFITNTANLERTYNLTFSGLPAGWTLLSRDMRSTSASLTLPPGELGMLGLYVDPDTDVLPAPGTVYPFTVSAVSDSGLSRNRNLSFTMPALPFSYVSVDPPIHYVEQGSQTTLDLGLTNVGNAAGNFPLLVTSPISTITPIAPLQSPQQLNPGESHHQQVTLDIGAAPLGQMFPIWFSSPSPDGVYMQTQATHVRVVDPVIGPIFGAAQCSLGSTALPESINALGVAVVQLQQWCDTGECPIQLRDNVVSAAQGVAAYAASASNMQVQADADVLAAAATLSTHTAPADISSDLQDLSDAVALLGNEICEIEEHMPEVRFNPYVDAILLGDTANFSLELTNLGTMTTTYIVTTTTPTGSQIFNPVVNPGATITLPTSTAPSSLGSYNLTADVAAAAPDVKVEVRTHAQARLNVVDRFVQLTTVRPDPEFVDTGTSATTIYIDVSNVANIVLPVNTRTTIQSPSGGVSYTADQPVTVLIGSPRTYQLQTVDTSGWASGVYTVTVALLDSADNLIPDGIGYGYLGVGQALGISHAVTPAIVPPGTVTVTTQITTEILSPTILPLLGPTQPHATSQPGNSSEPVAVETIDTGISTEMNESVQTTWAITRTEDTAPAVVYTGSWVVETLRAYAGQASNADFTWSSTAGDTAVFNFSGIWVHVGFNSSIQSGKAEILIDGVSQGIVDTYGAGLAFNSSVASFIYSGLADTSHTLTISITGTSNPFANGQRVGLDYIDTWDGTLMPDGTFEEDSSRIWYSTDWITQTSALASGGSYADTAFQGNPTAWYPFTGDSFTYRAIADSSAGVARLFVDGQPLGTLDLYSTDAVTHTFSYNGFGPGPHVLTLRHFLSDVTFDTFSTPGSPPYYQEPVYSGIVRYEEYHPGISYSGADYFHRPRTWGVSTTGGNSGLADVNSNAISDTVSLTFDGRWVNLGFRARSNGGQAEVFIDGLSHGIVGLYAPSEILTSFQFGGLVTGTHTLDLVVLGQPDPPSTGSYVFLDYIDVWDGITMPDGYVNVQRSEPSGRLHYSAGGVDANDANAYQGDYLATTLPNNRVNVWYAFTGDSFSYVAFSRPSGGTSQVYIDDVLVDTVSHAYPFSQQPIAFHYTGFTDGPHVVRVSNVLSMRVDAFASNPGSLATFQPMVEWYDNISGGASIWGGLHVPVAVGDVTGDGSVELVVASSDLNNSGTLFLMRGDGQDTGDGDPIIWSIPYNIFNGFEDVAAPTIAELDGQPGAEIIHATIEGVYVYHSDGSTYWMTDTLHSHVFFASPAVGNLDLDADPEIAINLSNSLVVFEADGTLAWSRPTGGTPSMPLLADMTGDGVLDILFQDGNTLNLYDYNLGSPVLAWSQTFTTALSVYGAPAVGDIDGLQPGGDPGPEIGISSNGWTHVLDEDGSFIWSTPLAPGDPGGVSIADLDGDGEVELVTTMLFSGGRIYALNADGSLLWDKPALDNSTLTASVMDLDGDGIYEVAWNGAVGGFTIFNGADGTVLFNEPHPGVISKTGSDYPVFADVDLDGYAEIVVASQLGVRVFGHDTVWGPARPLWNQHSYHITNINDDLSVPFSEPNSWEVHNTYRTQTPLRSPMPAYSVSITHTVGITDVSVLAGTFSTPPDVQSHPDYGWDYTQSWADLVITRTFDLRVDNLQPGETRMVGQQTVADYTLPSGSNHLILPPLFVSAPHIVSLSPADATVAAGGTAQFDMVLLNPNLTNADVFTLTLTGTPSVWADYPHTVNLAAGEQVTASLTITVPVGANPETLPVIMDVVKDSGGADQAIAQLTVFDGVDVSITPDQLSAAAGEAITYTLTISNLESVQRVYDLSAAGLAMVNLPASVPVDAGNSTSVVFTASAYHSGPQPFTIRAGVPGGAADSADAVLYVSGAPMAALSLAPDPAVTGPGSMAEMTLTLTNVGDLRGTFDLSVSVPSGWSYILQANGQPVSSLTLPAYLFNTADLELLVRPDVGAAPGGYPVSVSALPQGSSAAPVITTGTVQVQNRGVQVQIVSGPASLDPRLTGTWEVRVTNTGQTADTFDLQAAGILALAGQFSQNSVTLNPGQGQTVQLVSDNLDILLQQTYLVVVSVKSQTDSRISDRAERAVTLTGYDDVEITWQPQSQTVNGTLSASFSLVITNTGNLNTTYQISGGVSSGGKVSFAVVSLDLPAHSTAVMRAGVDVPHDGVYQVSAAAQGGQAQDSAIATLTVINAGEPPRLFLPLVIR